MELTRTRRLLPLVEWRESSLSTNAELRELALQGEDRAPHGTLVATSSQTAGRGRLGRSWITPPDTALAASLLVRGFGAAGMPVSWLPLLAGSAVVGALQPLFAGVGVDTDASADGDASADADTDTDAGAGSDGGGMRVGVKWPNDVHVRSEADAEAGRIGQKLCGILCDMLPDGSVVVGMGINLLIPEWELPTDRATSLLVAGADVGGAETLAAAAGRDLLDRVLHDVCAELLRLVERAEADPRAVKIQVARHSLTLGTEVRVYLPGGETVDGRARVLAEDGSLVVDLPTGGQLTVSAGDVEHLR